MKITYEKIMSFAPCYDPKNIGMPQDYEVELKDFIIEYKDKVENLSDILWVCCRNEFFNDRDLRLFGVWCALQVKHLMKDQRSLDCLEVAEKFAFGLATQEELSDASAHAARAAHAADAYAHASAWAYAVYYAYAAYYAASTAAYAASDAASDASAAYASAAYAAKIKTLLAMIDKPDGEWFKEWRRQQ